MGCSEEFVSNSKDPNYDWFQQDHDFKIRTRAQMKQFESQHQGLRMLKPKPKLNSTGPVISDAKTSLTTAQKPLVSKKRMWKEVTQGDPAAVV